MVVMVKKSAEVFRGRRLKLELELGLPPLPLGSHFFKPSRAPSITTTLSLQHIGGSSTTLYARLLFASAQYYHYVRLVLILPLYRCPSTDLEMLDSGLADRQDTTARRAVYHAAEPTTGSGILISRKRSWNCETVMSPAI